MVSTSKFFYIILIFCLFVCDLIEYTEMVDNLLKAFDRATERYLDQISSSDDEIAVEYPESESDSKTVTKKQKIEASPSKRKPTLAAQTDKKRERSLSEDSMGKMSDTTVLEKKTSAVKKDAKKNVNSKKKKNNQESSKKVAKKQVSPVRSRSPSVDKWSSSPPPSWPPSSPEPTPPKKQNNSVYSSDEDLRRKSKGMHARLICNCL